MSEVTPEEQLKLDEAQAEFEKSKQEYYKAVAEGIKAGYEEAKLLGKDIAGKTMFSYFFEKDLARMLGRDLKQTQGLLKHLDKFGMIDMKVIGAAVQLRIIRKPQEMLKKLDTFKAQLIQKMAELEVLMILVAEDLPKEQEDKVNENPEINNPETENNPEK